MEASHRLTSGLAPVLAFLGGAGLSFLAFGVLWIGTPWRYQALMGVPFFLLSFALVKFAPAERQRQVMLLLFTGAAPLGGLMTMFRDPSGSHLKPILIVCVWAAGIFAGYVAGRPSISRG